MLSNLFFFFCVKILKTQFSDSSITVKNNNGYMLISFAQN